MFSMMQLVDSFMKAALSIVCAFAVVFGVLPGAVGAGEEATGYGGGGATLPALFAAAREGDADRLRALLSVSRKVDARDEAENTPLIRAALCAGADCVRLLLDHGADPNARNRAGATPLLHGSSDIEKVRLLLDGGADPNIASELGNTPLILAARVYGAEPVARLLLDRGAKLAARNAFGVSAIQTAAASGDPRTVRLLVERGADVHANASEHIFSGWRTPLMWAAFQGQTDVMEVLLARGAKVDVASALGTPLSSAAQNDQLAAARLLLDRGAPVDQREPATGYSALHWAASTERDDPALVELLISRGADPNAKGGENVDAFLAAPRTPLLLAGARGTTSVVKALRRGGAKETGRAALATHPVAARSSAEPLDPARVRRAIAEAVPMLQETAIRSQESFVKQRNRQDCVSCHQQYLPLAAVSSARAAGVPVDEDLARRQLAMIRRIAREGREVLSQASFHPEPVYSLGYEALALAHAGVPGNDETDSIAHHLASIQAGDGRWRMNLPRPPIQTSDVGATALAALALTVYPIPGRRVEIAERVRRAGAWLRGVKPASNEERVYQLLGLAWSGVPPEELEAETRGLLAAQDAAGGWAQIPHLASDAYATAQAVYALVTAGRLAPSHPAIRRGAHFLLETRLRDGSWRVQRRAFPFQPTMQSGFPHGRDSWLSAAATSWAVLALSTLDVTPAAGAETPAASPAAAATPAAAPAESVAPSAPIDFATQVRPLLARSCLGCHQGKKPRSGFLVTGRAHLLAGGNLGEPAVVPGKALESPLWRYASGLEEEMEMPPLNKRDRFAALDEGEIALLGAWIDQGAPWPEDVRLDTDG